jgi:hypothetical protein
VPIGDTPARARQRAGLTVAQVSEQTRIREAASHGPAHRPRGRWLSWAVVLGLVVVLGFGVYSRFSGPRHTAAVPPAGGKHAATHQQPGPGGPGPAPKLTHAAVTPAPAPSLPHAAVPAPAPKLTHAGVAPAPAVAAPARTLTPASAGAPAPRATGGSRAAGPAHPVVRHRPLPEPVPQQRPAHERARPGHDHGRRDHHRRRAPAEKRPHPDLPRPG